MADGEFHLIPDKPGWVLVMDGVALSWVDPDDPTRLEFGYMLRMADYLDECAPPGERMRVIHVGGAAMVMARYVAARRPTSPQIVLEPNAALIEMVRTRLPLPARSGIKVRAVDGRSGISAMPNHYARVVIVDAFADARVPADLVSAEFVADVARVLRDDGLLLFNLIDISPLRWTRRVLATLELCFPNLALSAESATLKGRRHGNLVAAASRVPLPMDRVVRRAAGSAFPYRVLHGQALQQFKGFCEPFTDADAEPSPGVERGLRYFE